MLKKIQFPYASLSFLCLCEQYCCISAGLHNNGVNRSFYHISEVFY